MKVDIDQRSAAEVNKILTQLGKSVNKELAVAVNKTTVQARTAAARKMKEKVPVPVRVLKKAIYQLKKATEANPSSGIRLWRGYQIPLKYFKAQQRAGGVSYQAGSLDKSHGYRPHAFIVKKLGNHVFTRKFKQRLPIEQQFGIAPADANEGVAEVAVETAKDKLPKQIQERVRYLTEKAQGNLK
jgi:hypothetical protein